MIPHHPDLFPDPRHIIQLGTGQVQTRADQIDLCLPPASADQYHDAQISDYHSSRDFRWSPPLRLTVRAQIWVDSTSSRSPVGTAGFGFWNHPFVPGERGFRLPKAAWFFFSSPPSNMRLAAGVPGPGWKAATIDATRWPFLALLPTAPLGFLLMRLPPLYRRLWPIAQSAVGVSECLLPESLLAEPHSYTLDWQPDGLTFRVDEQVVHQCAAAPRGRLGLIAWIDNQYAIVTPQGQFGFGLVTVPFSQHLLLHQVLIAPL